MTRPTDEREEFAAFLLRLRGAGIVAPALVAAIEATPRRGFVPAEWQEVVWRNNMLPIPCGEAIEAIDMQALALAALGLESGHRVLEVGTGSGYGTALLGRLSGRVLSIERFRTLKTQAEQRLTGLGIQNVLIRHADGVNGAAVDGPFDRIIVWSAFDSLPRHFVEQLASGGVMVAPIGPSDGVQKLAKLTKLGSRFEREDIADVRLQPLAQGLAQSR